MLDLVVIGTGVWWMLMLKRKEKKEGEGMEGLVVVELGPSGYACPDEKKTSRSSLLGGLTKKGKTCS